MLPPLPQPQADIPDDGGDSPDEGPIEAEFVDEENGSTEWPAAAQPGSRS